MKVGWNYIWRFGVGALIGAASAAAIAVGISTGITGIIVGGVAGVTLLGIYCLTVIMPWTRRWIADI
jgi:hypothetical protein